MENKERPRFQSASHDNYITYIPWFLILLFLAGIFLFNEKSISVLLLDGHPVTSPPFRSLLLGVDLFLFVLAVMAFKERKSFDLNRYFLKTIALLVMVLLMEIGLNLAFMIVFPGRDIRTFKPKIDPRATFPAHHGAEWPLEDAHDKGAGFYRKIVRFHPFYGWTGSRFDGKWTHVDDHGFRQTWNPPESKSSRKVFVFGGSTVWGIGARDDFTIPSLISKSLDSLGIPAEVVNCGDLAYISNQEMLKLAEMLRKGYIPDLAIFYHGYNDVTYAFRTGEAGRMSLLGMGNRFDMALLNDRHLYNSRRQIYQGLEAISQRLLLCRSLGFVIKRMPLFRSKEGSGRMKSAGQREKLSDSIRDNYLENVEMVQSLAKAYGFRTVFFWQPVMLLEDHLLPGEIPAYEYHYTPRPSYEQWPPRDFETWKYQSVNGLLPDSIVAGFYNISDALKERKGPVYIDAIHLSEAGNRLVTGRIMQILEEGGYLEESER